MEKAVTHYPKSHNISLPSDFSQWKFLFGVQENFTLTCMYYTNNLNTWKIQNLCQMLMWCLFYHNDPNISDRQCRPRSDWAPSSESVSSSIPSWQILTVHAQPLRGARDLAFCLKVPLDSMLVWASSGGSGETARMRRLAWTVAARIGDKDQIRLTRSRLLFEEQSHCLQFHLYLLEALLHGKTRLFK